MTEKSSKVPMLRRDSESLRGKIKPAHQDPARNQSAGRLAGRNRKLKIAPGIQKPIFEKIAIIGMGLIGGSLGLAIKKRNLAQKVIGISRSQESLRKALEKGAVDEISRNKEKVKEADFIIVAAPVGVIPELVREILPFLKSKEVIITDVGSTKKTIMERIKKFIPPKIVFIGSHPLAGSEKKGIEFAKTTIFNSSVCFLTPFEDSNSISLEKLKRFWQLLGSLPLVVSPEAHDFIVGGISHLPHLAAVGLINSLEGVKYQDKEIVTFAGKGFKDTTRVASGSPDIWIDIIRENREEILNFLHGLEENLERLSLFIRNGEWSKINKELNQAEKVRKLIE